MSLLRSRPVSSGAEEEKGEAPAVVSPFDLNPIPKLVEEYLAEGWLTIDSHSYYLGRAITYYIFTSHRPPFIYVAWLDPAHGTRNTYSAVFNKPITGFVNGSTWNTFSQPYGAACGCSECIKDRGTLEEHTRRQRGVMALEAVLALILSGRDLYRFQCGMAFTNLHADPGI